MATASAVQLGGHGASGTLGAWSPRALRRARAKLPAAVLATLGQDGVGVPAAVAAAAAGRFPPACPADGRAVLAVVGDRHAACPNLRVRMTGRGHRAPGGAWLDDAGEPMVEWTTDPFDRAHREFRGELLASGRVAMHARPRQYHRMYMVGPAGSRVSVETAIERAEEAAHRHGLHRGPSMGEAVASVLVRADEVQVRTAVRGARLSERYGESAAERAEAAAMAAHERAVAALLAAGGGA